MILKPQPITLPLTANALPTQPWAEYFASLDQQVRSAPSFPTPLATETGSAGLTLSAAQLLAGLLIRSGPAGAFSDATPTAAQIVAAIPKASINSNRLVLIQNGGGGVMTLTAGTGVTLKGNTTIAASFGRIYLVTATAVAAGAEAVSVRGLITAGF